LKFGHGVLVTIKDEEDFQDLVLDGEATETKETEVVGAIEDFCTFAAELQSTGAIAGARLLL